MANRRARAAVSDGRCRYCYPRSVAVDPMDQLRRLVLADPSLCQALAAITDRHEFTTVVAALARKHALALDPPDIECALVAARRVWLQRWV